MRGWAGDRVQRPGWWANQKVLYDAKRRTHTAQGVALSTIHGDLLWCDGGWPGSCHEHELLEVSGVSAALDATGVTALVDRGFRGMAKVRVRWHAPIGTDAAAALAWPAVPGPGRLPGRRGAHLARPMDPPHPDMKKSIRTPSLTNWSTML